MEIGTALITIALLYFLITSQGFRRFTICATGIVIVGFVAFYLRAEQVQRQHAAEYRAQQAERLAQQAKEEWAKNYVDGWAKDKPLFQEVRHEMARLLQTGEVPLLADGSIDLDAAYNKASEQFIAVKYPWIAPPSQPVHEWLPGENAKPDGYQFEITPRPVKTVH